MPRKLTQDEFIERAKIVHGDKYDYSKVKYVNSQTKVCIICPIHGEFLVLPHEFLDSYKCPKCRYQSDIQDNEVLLDIKGHDGVYKISNLGNVYSTFYGFNRKLRYSINGAGYKCVHLSKDGISKTYQIHTLVARHFIGEQGKNDIDHINFNKLDNRVENLQYISHLENVRRSKHYIKPYDKRYEHNPKSKVVIGYKDGNEIVQYGCGKTLCDILGMNYSTFKCKMQRGGILINDIYYKYGIKDSKGA